jgi:peptidoglycan/xylan/chitin deacetylase (PgdA/CDA1 family)
MLQPTRTVRLFFGVFAFWLAFLFVFTSNTQAQSPQLNGLLLDGADPTALSGVVRVFGVADHPTFRKWQIDLVLDDENVAFLSLGEKPQVAPGLLVALDTQIYPDGEYRLRLRVVHGSLNYEEYFLPVRIANGSSPIVSDIPPVASPSQPAPLPQPVAAPAPTTPLSQNGLSLTSQDGLLSVRGVADHPAFLKWQIDLLLYGDADQAAFLAVGEERVPDATQLTSFYSADYPEGEHQLRLRVVRRDQNYDEYLLPVVIGSGNSYFATGRDGAPTPLQIRGPAENKAIYLTFDDGPHPDNTPQILEVLAEYNAKATFFVVGSRAQGQGDLIKSMYEAGHAIGNHSWSHRKLDNMDWETFEDEIGATAEVLGGYSSRCLRPPYGNVGQKLYDNAKQAEYRIIYWNVDPLDWLNQNPETIANRVLTRARPGAIVLLHDGGDSRAGTVAALRTILATLTADGYTFPALCR